MYSSPPSTDLWERGGPGGQTLGRLRYGRGPWQTSEDEEPYETDLNRYRPRSKDSGLVVSQVHSGGVFRGVQQGRDGESLVETLDLVVAVETRSQKRVSCFLRPRLE